MHRRAGRAEAELVGQFAVLRFEYLYFRQKSRLFAGTFDGKLGRFGFGDGLGLDSDDCRLSGSVFGQHDIG